MAINNYILQMKMNREEKVQTKLDLTYKVDDAGSPMKLTGAEGLPVSLLTSLKMRATS
ncbi:unnamed protein product [Echinostoma caproni]|uniref:Aconitate hydratase n=1 Tax=Echinostoma caproni TaxID=27848 RepID=A0A183BG99_9TREM|nr:unnamed protein product [Echinostoma caproni]